MQIRKLHYFNVSRLLGKHAFVNLLFFACSGQKKTARYLSTKIKSKLQNRRLASTLRDRPTREKTSARRRADGAEIVEHQAVADFAGQAG